MTDVKKSSKKPKASKRKKQVRWSHVILLIVLLLGIVGASAIGTIILAAMSSIPDLDEVHIGDYEISSQIYDKDNTLIQELSVGNNYTPIKTEEMSPLVLKAITSIEDKRFYKHTGIDPVRIAGAFLSNIKAGHITQGGSTITQQLAGLALLDRDEKTYKRKIQEAIIALRIDKKYSKDEILTMYLNRCYFGIGLSGRSCYGIEAASNDYFGKHASELTLEEAALLAGMVQNPGKWSPLASVENAKERRALVLQAMYNNNVISKEELEKAKASKILVKTSLQVSSDANKNPYAQSYIDYVMHEATHHLKLESADALFTGGYKIYTQMDSRLQNYMYDYFNNAYNFPSGNSNEPIQGAMIVMNSKNGEIAGLIGGRNVSTARTLNRAYQTTRQPGSTFKPIYDYAPAFEAGYGTGSVEIDKPYEAGSHTIKNYDFKYYGPTTYRQALIRSSNTVAVRVLEKVGVRKGMEMAKKLGISTLAENGRKNDLNLSAGLGGLTNGVTVRDMAGAYGVFANKGQYNKPHAIVKIVNQQGKVVYSAENKPKQVISEDTAFMISSCLSDVVSKGTGILAKIYDGRVTAGKTGTTDNSKDLWFAGYTPQYVGCVWIGYDQPATIYATSDATSKIFAAIMSFAHQGLAYEDFERPNSIVNVWIDTTNGNLASRSTPSFNRSNEYYRSGTQPTTYSTAGGGNWEQSSETTDTESEVAEEILPEDIIPNEVPSNSNGDNTIAGLPAA